MFLARLQQSTAHLSVGHPFPSRSSPKKRHAWCLRCSARASTATQRDREYMRRALDLAATGLGKTEPNPAVGCVIVQDDQIVGEGFHPKAGEPHAEVFALRAAGRAAKGSTAYVTLEPCNHYGRTPPCSQALVDAGISRVVIGIGDPNPLVGGSGAMTCRDAGMDVIFIGDEEAELCYTINRDFMQRMQDEAKLKSGPAASSGNSPIPIASTQTD